MKIISIIGNANVGKSTLFNQLVQSSQKSITSDFPGVTRDYKIADAQLADLKFKLIDTAGFSLKIYRGEDLSGRINSQTITAISKSDLILFMVDGALGVTAQDQSIAVWLKKKNLPAILVVNKADAKRVINNFYEFYQLGYKMLCAISAEHNQGFNVLYEFISEKIKSSSNDEGLKQVQDQSLKIAIIGRPNVGKSTLINSFLNEERIITGKEAGITRDSIFINMIYKKQNMQLIDTAGMRKQGKVENKIEKMSVKKSIMAIKICDVVVLVVDVNDVLKKQDLKLASIIIQNEVRPLVIAVNKVDLVEINRSLCDDIDYVVRAKLPQATQMQVVYISALDGKNINKILDACITLHDLYSIKISTSKLNTWLGQAVETHQPPLSKLGRRIKIKFISQIGSSPPTFQIFSNQAQEISDQYIRYLTRSLQNHFKLHGVPIRICKMKAKNPYQQ